MLSVEAVKKKLHKYTREQIRFNEPHFSVRLQLREGKRQDILEHLRNPTKLVYVLEQQGTYGDSVYALLFKESNTQTLKIPVIFMKKTLYVLTFIRRYRPWQNMIRRKK
ncbi:MAG: hypothetical protein OXR66_04530 [Candidatus Woesearchaeota archaeon]|nr:hypothetical protein [Candidatus Woesearchaeota archaeon]